MRILLQKSSKFRSFNYKSEEPGQMNLLNPNRNKMQSLIKTTDNNSKTEMLSSLTQNCVCVCVCVCIKHHPNWQYDSKVVFASSKCKYKKLIIKQINV